MRAKWLVLVGMVLALGGCDWDFIKITVTPKADGSFERVMRLWRETSDDEPEKRKIVAPPETLLKAPTTIYGEPEETPGAEVQYRGVFRTVPADLEDDGQTNRGGYDVVRSPLGTAHYYRERLPGRTDIHRTIEDLGVLVDAAAEIAAVLVEQELAGEKGVEKLAAALRGSIGTDVKDLLTLYLVWVCAQPAFPDAKEESESEDERETSITAYILQVLEERGYVKLATLPRVLTEDDFEQVALRWAARTMGREANESFSECFDFLRNGKRFEAALEEAVETAGLDKEDLTERAGRVAGGIVGSIFGLEPQIDLEVRTPVAPYATNGRWSEKSGSTSFASKLSGHTILPPMAFVAWSVPDAAWQQARLGRVAITGLPLARLAFWESGLPEGKLAAWTMALDALDPSGDLDAQLRAIRLTDEKDEEPVRGATLILKALGSKVKDGPK